MAGNEIGFRTYSNGKEVERTPSEPSLEEDLANFPYKTKEEVKYARGLWASGMLEINNEDDDNIHSRVFVPKALTCSVFRRVQELVPAYRSWPVIDWSDIVEPELGLEPGYGFDLWGDIDRATKFLYSGKVRRDNHLRNNYMGEETGAGYIRDWCMGAALGSPKYQNIAMSYMMERDTLGEIDLAQDYEVKHEIFAILADEDLDAISSLREVGFRCMENAAFEPHKLLSYMLDKLVWEAAHGGYSWLKYVYRGGCLANVVARAQVDALKNPAARFAPWHISNQHRYLLSEVPDRDTIKTEKKRPKRVNTEGSASSIKKQRVA
ncbi:uncharacterized protein L3040_002037 [Drepanopeziza brunnea f. sp. 'multigermtubi']|uniref:Uncharacterized protein n=1 Tax=Marssonina brunnea f. sp. multigermtubi (strain MB_m1) TaxID=1072389 RepID=K1WPU7_MARBU|nr:uncharacterized protein MBM_01572 [Drepanopeziza brunnea f. sp. 'multigermtubi' MB_m1]EKD19620.1 hypothetical protein MBM_01572 [Drepanopeziza brunnea f. sp. 'multigermtubi' MB_m1]KAJ5052283.1 hypothetical protein L3040_002037 [Drepanopeziza brunnea f. sp. 'multigermtubi']